MRKKTLGRPTRLLILTMLFTAAQALEENPISSSEANIAWAGIGIVTILVGLSILFEVATEKLKEETDEMNMPFVHTIFNELTTLGFIGLILFVVSKLDILSTISLRYLGEAEKLQETIEIMHMALFMFVIIFLVLCVGLLRFGMNVQEEWRMFERRSSDLTTVILDYTLATEPFNLRDYFNVNKVRAMHRAKRELVYLALRQRFVDPSATSNTDSEKKNKLLRRHSSAVVPEYQGNPEIRFPFNEYLSIISGEVMGQLIEIDVLTWVSLELIIVILWFICESVGPTIERYIMLTSGGLLILLNQYVYSKIDAMRHALTPPILHKKAEILRNRRKWRARNNLNENSRLLGSELFNEDCLTEGDYVPPFIASLPHGGKDMTLVELNSAQRSILSGGKSPNGVLVAMFSTRMVFLLTAMHLSIFLVREAFGIYNANESSWPIWYFFMTLPSLLVVYMATRSARDGLYAFNVEYMKIPRVISKVMRVLKARQTLRTLRFVAEMKVYLRGEDERRQSVLAISSPKSIGSDREDDEDVVISPRAKSRVVHRRLNDAYAIEQERREINSIFALFDTDGSGSVSRSEMQSLLTAITHDLSDSQVNRIMTELTQSYDSDEEITFEKFYNWCHKRIRECQHTRHELIEEIFNMVDEDGSGEITVDEFIAIFETLGQSLDHDDVRELVYQMDRNDDGKINLEEFSKMIHKHAI